MNIDALKPQTPGKPVILPDHSLIRNVENGKFHYYVGIDESEFASGGLLTLCGKTLFGHVSFSYGKSNCGNCFLRLSGYHKASRVVSMMDSNG